MRPRVTPHRAVQGLTGAFSWAKPLPAFDAPWGILAARWRMEGGPGPQPCAHTGDRRDGAGRRRMRYHVHMPQSNCKPGRRAHYQSSSEGRAFASFVSRQHRPMAEQLVCHRSLSRQRLRRCACRALPPYCREQPAPLGRRGSRERRSPGRHYRIRSIRSAGQSRPHKPWRGGQ